MVLWQVLAWRVCVCDLGFAFLHEHGNTVKHAGGSLDLARTSERFCLDMIEAGENEDTICKVLFVLLFAYIAFRFLGLAFSDGDGPQLSLTASGRLTEIGTQAGPSA